MTPIGSCTRSTTNAEGTQNGVPVSFDGSYQVGEGQLLTVPLVLKSQAPEYLTPGQLRCMLGAKGQEDVLKCLPQKTKPLVDYYDSLGRRYHIGSYGQRIYQ